MHATQNTRIVPAISPQGPANGTSFTASEVDTVGYDYATFLVQVGSASDAGLASLTVTECDTTGGAFEDVTGTDLGVSENVDGDSSSLPAATEDGVIAIEMNLRNRERFLKLSASGGSGSTGTFASACCVLSQPQESPVSVSDRGCLEILRR